MTMRHTLNDAHRVTQAAGLRLRALEDGANGEVSCPSCGCAFDVNLARWVALRRAERGCPQCSVKKGAA